MKKVSAIILAALTIFSLVGCGKEVPVSAEEAGVVIPRAVPPEEPGAGRVLVHMQRDYAQDAQCWRPIVSVSLREEASAAINQVLEEDAAAFFSAAGTSAAVRSCAVPREDKQVLSIVYTDDIAGERRLTGRVLSTVSGLPLTFVELTSDMEALCTLCGEYRGAMTGTPGLVQSIPEDGCWYLSTEGLVILEENSSFTFPYPVVAAKLNEAVMPPEEEPVNGTLQASYSNEMNAGITYLDELTLLNGIESVAIRSRGTLRDVKALSVEGESLAETDTLWTCSRMENGEAVRFNVTLSDGTPTLKLVWTTDESYCEAFLYRNGETGSAALLQTVGIEQQDTAPVDGPYADIQATALMGYWSNGLAGRGAQALSLQKLLCYVWNGERGLDGSCFRWALIHSEDPEEPPQLVIYTDSENGDLIYTIDEFTGTTFHTVETDSTFTLADAVG